MVASENTRKFSSFREVLGWIWNISSSMFNIELCGTHFGNYALLNCCNSIFCISCKFYQYAVASVLGPRLSCMTMAALTLWSQIPGISVVVWWRIQAPIKARQIPKWTYHHAKITIKSLNLIISTEPLWWTFHWSKVHIQRQIKYLEPW